MFLSKNEIEQFDFEDCVIGSFKAKENEIVFELESLLVKPKNSQNTNFTLSYADTVTAVLKGGKLLGVIEEGFKEYDANDVLLREEPDRELSVLEADEIITKLPGAFMFSFEKCEGKGEDGKLCYEAELEFPTEDGIADPWNKTYVLCLEFEESEFSWERYLNRAQK